MQRDSAKATAAVVAVPTADGAQVAPGQRYAARLLLRMRVPMLRSALKVSVWPVTGAVRVKREAGPMPALPPQR